MLLLLAGSTRGGEPGQSSCCPTRPLVKVGDWSYSIYLWHWPVIVFAGLLWPGEPWPCSLAALVSLAPALASYRWVEQPIRRRPTVSRPRTAGLVAAWIVPPVVLASIVGVSASRDLWVAQLWVPELSTFSSWSTSHEGWDDCLSRGTLTGDPTQVNQFGDCVWNATATGAPLYLVGDSNANQFSEALIGVGDQLARGSPSIRRRRAPSPISPSVRMAATRPRAPCAGTTSTPP